MYKIGFIGAGNMAFALAAAISSKYPDTQFYIHDISSERLSYFHENIQNTFIEKSNKNVAENCAILFLAVKPQYFVNIFEDIHLYNKLVISIAAGITTAAIEDEMPAARVVRVMPNTPSLVGEMAAGFCSGKKTETDDIEIVQRLLNSAGIAFRMEEVLLNTVTGLSGSGPAFIAYIIKAFIDAGINEGLSDKISRDLVIGTIKGTARLLEEKEMSAEELINMVSSPGGTTVAGRKVLEESNIYRIIQETISAAVNRSKELGK